MFRAWVPTLLLLGPVPKEGLDTSHLGLWQSLLAPVLPAPPSRAHDGKAEGSGCLDSARKIERLESQLPKDAHGDVCSLTHSAIDEQLSISGQFADTSPELMQWNVRSIREVPRGEFARLAHI